MEALLNHLVYGGLMAGAMVLLLCALRRFGRAALGSRLLYAAWLLIAIRLLAPLGLPVAAQPARVMNRPIHAVFEVRATPAQQTGSAAQTPSAPAAPEPGAKPATVDLPTLLTWLWAGGALATAGFMCARNAAYRRALRMRPLPPGRRARVDEAAASLGLRLPPVVQSAQVRTPCLVGALRPRVVLPEDTSGDGMLAYALLHEACHARAGDTRWAVLRNLCCCLFWFHPLVWMAARMSRADAELACDERVLARLQADGRYGYAQALVLAAAHGRGASGRPGVAFDGAPLGHRIQYILEVHPVKKSILLVTAVLLLALLTASFATAQGTEGAFIPSGTTAGQPTTEADEAFLAAYEALVAAHGDVNAWTLAQRAELGDLMAEHGVVDASTERFGLPQAGEMTEEEGIRIALETVAEGSDLTPDELRATYAIEVYFWRFGDDSQNPFWQIDLRTKEDGNDALIHSVSIDAKTGELVTAYMAEAWALMDYTAMEAAREALEVERGLRYDQWPIEQMAAFDREWYGEDASYIAGIPTEAQTQEADAVRIATEALGEKYGLSQADVDEGFDVWRMFIVGSPELQDDYWIITFVTKGENPGEGERYSEAYTVFLDGNTGEAYEAFDQNDGIG